VLEGKYSIELFHEDGEDACIEAVVARDDRLHVARTLYEMVIEQYPGRLVMLCDRARVLARSDRPSTWPK